MEKIKILKLTRLTLVVGLLLAGCSKDEPIKDPTPPVISDVKIIDNGDDFVTVGFTFNNPDRATLQEVGVMYGLKGQSLDNSEISFVDINDTNKTINTTIILDNDTEFDFKPYVKYNDKVIEYSFAIAGHTISSKWRLLKDFPGVGRVGAVSFVVDNKVYLGLGANNIEPSATEFYKDFWMYNTLTDEWNQLPEFPGDARGNGFCFVMDGKGYVGGGRSNVDDSQAVKRDFWEFNPVDNSWVRKNDLPDLAFVDPFNPFLYPVSVAANGVAYYGTGLRQNFGVNSMFRYNSDMDSWTQILDYPLEAFGLASFIIGNRLFVGDGAITLSNEKFTRKFYRLEFLGSDWIEIASSPAEINRTGLLFDRAYGPLGFSIGDFGYLIDSSRLWKYDPVSNGWAKSVNFSVIGIDASAREYKGFVGGASGGKGYFGLGFALDYSGISLSKRWAVFDPLK